MRQKKLQCILANSSHKLSKSCTHLANKVLHVTNGEAFPYPGGYDYFLEKTGGIFSEREALTAA